MPFSEPWFTKKSKLQVEQLLYNSFHVDGYFLVNPDYSKENNSVVALYLSVMCSDVLHQFKIVQVCYDFGFYTYIYDFAIRKYKLHRAKMISDENPWA